MTRWTFYLSSEEVWEAMHRVCAGAGRSIDFEQFIFDNDEVGERFANLFIKKAKEGVAVRLLVDSAGSMTLHNSPLEVDMRKAGVQILFFNSISPWTVRHFKLWFNRDHRKLAVIDGEIGFIGGVGIGQRLSGWRDTHVEIEGPIVKDMEENFGRMWRAVFFGKRPTFTPPRHSDNSFFLATNSPRRRGRYIHRIVIEAIRAARRRVYFTTPYFVPDRRFFRVLRLAARRGVDVRILLPDYSDHSLVDAAGYAHFTRAMRAGIRIFKYESSMLHSKTLVIDDDWATVGSSNMDNQSFFLNQEANIFSNDWSFVEELTNHFFEDTRKAREVNLRKWYRRPFLDKLYEQFALLFEDYL